MNLEHLKGVIRKQLVNTTDNDNSGIKRKEDQQDVKPLQSNCVSIRVPVQITIRNSTGIADIYTARTILVNQRGARFECPLPDGKRPSKQHCFKLYEQLWIEVPSTGKATGGKITWADTHPNLHGNFEFAVEFDESRNLFNASFSPKDCERPGTTALTDPPCTTPTYRSSKDWEPESAAQTIPDRSVLETIKVESQKEVAAAPRPMNSILVNPSPEICQTNVEETAASPATLSQFSSSPGPEAATASYRQRPNSVHSGNLPMTDRLAEAIKEVISSAVQSEESAASERLVKEVKDQVGLTQQAALENMRNEIVQRVSVLEEQLLQQCRARTEQMLSATLETAIHALSDQIGEIAGRTEARVQTVFNDLAEQLEQRSAKALAEATSRLEEEMEKSAKGAHGAIVQKVLEELNEKQKDMMEQVQRQIGMATEQNLIRLRGGLTRTLQELTVASQNGSLAL